MSKQFFKQVTQSGWPTWSTDPMFWLSAWYLSWWLKVVRFCQKSNHGEINITTCSVLTCSGVIVSVLTLQITTSYLLLLKYLASRSLNMRPRLSPVVPSVFSIFKISLKLLQLTVDLHLFSFGATRTQLMRGQRHTMIVMISLPWKERWQQYAEQMVDGAPLQSAGGPQVTW